jgi:hypothetical protein
VDALARSIADKAARADIEEFCDRCGEHFIAPERTFALTPVDETVRRDVLLAVAYLELRGLLVSDPQRPEMVRLL